MDCNDVKEQLGDYLDKEMLAELCREIDAHLMHCKDCTVEVDTIRKTIVLYQADSNRSLQVPLRVTQRLEQALANEYGKGRQAGTD